MRASRSESDEPFRGKADAGGLDTYQYPAMPNPAFVVPSEGGLWGWEPAMLPTEHGGGVDGDGPSGVHPEAGG